MKEKQQQIVNATLKGNAIQIFENQLFGKIRFLEKDKKQFAVATDVAKALGYVNPHDAVKKHCRWVAKCEVPHPQSKNKTLEINIIPEGDLYRLVANSELPNALEFESWIFDEVLPTIRKHGIYITDEAYQEYLNDKDMFDKRISEAHEKIQTLRLENEELNQANELLTKNYNDIRLMYQNCTNEVAEYVNVNLVHKKTGKVKGNDLYNHYCRWCRDAPHYEPYDRKQFEELLLERMVDGHSIVKDGNYYKNIEVRK